jgi:hypothetical protein
MAAKDPVELLGLLKENAEAGDLESNNVLVGNLTKVSLMKLAKHLELGVKYSARKAVYYESVCTRSTSRITGRIFRRS